MGKACLSDSSRNGLYGSQHGVEQLRQLPGRSLDTASLLHNKSRERQHICFKGAFVTHFCWLPEFLPSQRDKMLSCCVEILGSCCILRRSCVWLCCWSEFIKMFLRPCDLSAQNNWTPGWLHGSTGMQERSLRQDYNWATSALLQALKLALCRSSYIFSLYIRLIIMQNSRWLHSWIWLSCRSCSAIGSA